MILADVEFVAFKSSIIISAESVALEMTISKSVSTEVVFVVDDELKDRTKSN